MQSQALWSSRTFSCHSQILLEIVILVQPR